MNNLKIPEFLLQICSIVNLKDESENTPLHLAVRHNNKESVELLCKYGANVNLKDESENTPLHLAVTFKNNL